MSHRLLPLFVAMLLVFSSCRNGDLSEGSTAEAGKGTSGSSNSQGNGKGNGNSPAPTATPSTSTTNDFPGKSDENPTTRPFKLDLDGPSSLAAASCGAYTVELQTKSGDPTSYKSGEKGRIVWLGGANIFYGASDCGSSSILPLDTNGKRMLLIPERAESASFYLRDFVGGTICIKAEDGGKERANPTSFPDEPHQLSPDELCVVITPSPPGGLEFKVVTAVIKGVEITKTSPLPLPYEGNILMDVAVQSDDKVVAVGENNDLDTDEIPTTAIVRYNADGTRDATFGTQGIVLKSAPYLVPPYTELGPEAVAIQTDGKIVVAGDTAMLDYSQAPFVLRYLSNGVPDPTFGAGGMVTTQFLDANNDPTLSYATDVLIQPDGKILVTGLTNTPLAGDQFYFMIRYRTDGSLDPSFGIGGTVKVRLTDVFPFLPITANKLKVRPALLSDGKIVLGANYSDGTTSGHHFFVARHLANGGLDSTFGCGTPGSCTGIGVGSSFFANTPLALQSGMALQSDGKILMVGQGAVSASPPANMSIVMARFNADGTSDVSFGGGAVVQPTYSNACLRVVPHARRNLAVAPDGKIFVGGFTQDMCSGFKIKMMVARMTPAGAYDTTWGDGNTGIIRFHMGDGSPETGRTLRLQADGRILFGGSAVFTDLSNLITSYFGLSRFFP